MSETLQYGFDETTTGVGRLCMQMGPELWFKFSEDEQRRKLVSNLGAGSVKVITGQLLEDGSRKIILNDRRIGRPLRNRPKSVLTAASLELIGAIESVAADLDMKDPRIQPTIAHETAKDTGFYDCQTTLVVANMSSDASTYKADTYMQNMAANLRFVPEDKIPQTVFCEFSTKSGVSLTIDPLAKSRMAYEGPIQKGEPIELVGHNITTHEQQLICLAGAVALARA